MAPSSSGKLQYSEFPESRRPEAGRLEESPTGQSETCYFGTHGAEAALGTEQHSGSTCCTCAAQHKTLGTGCCYSLSCATRDTDIGIDAPGTAPVPETS